MEIPHIPVLKDEIIEFFGDIDEGYVVDCTLGYGGHSEALLKSNPNIKMICCDRDDEAIEFSAKRLKPYEDRVEIYKSNFSKMLPKIRDKNIKGILADIGVSSLQLDKTQRGFSFDSEALDMRMSKDNPLSAYEVVNNYSYEELCRVLKEYSDLTNIKQIATKICEQRAIKPIESAKELSSLASKVIYGKKIHPATLLFQAIRIEVNDELGELQTLLNSIRELSLKGTKIAIVSFHSLEDRIVKETFKEWANRCICPSYAIRCECSKDNDFGVILSKKPITPTQKEIDINVRSRSSKMRLFKTHE